MIKHIAQGGLWAFFALTGCQHQPYQAAPVNAAHNVALLQQHNCSDANFEQHLLKHGYTPAQLPIRAWDLNTLTNCTLYAHPDLNVAKKQLALAQFNIEKAGLKSPMGLNSHLSRSNQANGDLNPWSYGLGVDIPIITHNKRAFKIEDAHHLAEVARLDVAQTAWQLRSKIAQDLIAYHENQASIVALQQQVQLQQQVAAILQKRLVAGLVSQLEINTQQLNLTRAKHALLGAQEKTKGLLALLAADVALPVENLNLLPIKTLASTQLDVAFNTPTSYKTLQEKALLNRLDVRRALAKYAASEAKLKLEVAKQMPDITLSPTLAFDFGDTIWSLGFASLFNSLKSNQTMIEEAKKLRDIEGAQIMALQSQILGDLNQGHANYQAKHAQHTQLGVELEQEQGKLHKIERQFKAGQLDQLDFTLAKLTVAQARQQLTSAQFQTLKAAVSLEDKLQYPQYTAYIFDGIRARDVQAAGVQMNEGK